MFVETTTSFYISMLLYTFFRQSEWKYRGGEVGILRWADIKSFIFQVMVVASK